LRVVDLGKIPVRRLAVATVILALFRGIILLLGVFLRRIRKKPFLVSRRRLIGWVVNVAGFLLDGERKAGAVIG